MQETEKLGGESPSTTIAGRSRQAENGEKEESEVNVCRWTNAAGRTTQRTELCTTPVCTSAIQTTCRDDGTIGRLGRLTPDTTAVPRSCALHHEMPTSRSRAHKYGTHGWERVWGGRHYPPVIKQLDRYSVTSERPGCGCCFFFRSTAASS